MSGGQKIGIGGADDQRSIEIIGGRRSWPKAGEGHWKVVARGVWQCQGWRRRDERMKSDF